MVGIHANVLGRYERGEARPFVEMAAKLSDALEVSVDYLIGKSTLVIDKSTMERIEKTSELTEDIKSYIFNLIDMYLRDFKIKKAYL